MDKRSGRGIGLIYGINDWTKHLHRSLIKRRNSKIVRRALKRENYKEYEKTL